MIRAVGAEVVLVEGENCGGEVRGNGWDVVHDVEGQGNAVACVDQVTVVVCSEENDGAVEGGEQLGLLTVVGAIEQEVVSEREGIGAVGLGFRITEGGNAVIFRNADRARTVGRMHPQGCKRAVLGVVAEELGRIIGTTDDGYAEEDFESADENEVPSERSK